jgi:hypothetical protein
MAETLISPGVLARENDQSFITQQPITVGAAIIGPTVKGPVEVPTIVTSYSDYQNRFGTTFLSASQVYSYFTSIAAFNYFNNGGETMLVARVASGSWTEASSSIVNSTLATTASFNTTLTAVSESVSGSGSGSLNINGIDLLFTGSINDGINTSLVSGNRFTTVDNIRWQIANNDTSSGTFSLLVRQGDDNTIINCIRNLD